MLTTVEKELAYLLQYDPPYEWRGGNKALIESRAPEVIAEGGSETGKTMAACYKMHYNCREYPKSQHTLVRKVAATIPPTVLVTMKRIIGDFPVNYYGGDKNPEMIIYPNGSVIWLAGMDKPGKALSGERDTIQVCQAEELSIEDWEVLTTRVTGRGAVMPYTQIFGDCNPAGSRHHLKERARLGNLLMYHTTLKDNPSLYYADDTPTPQGLRTVAALEKLTGIRRKRLKDGIWATAEGAVYDTFDASIHVFTRALDEFKIFALAMDEGYTNPAVILLVGIDADDRWHIFREYYERGKLQSEVVRIASEWMNVYEVKLPDDKTEMVRVSSVVCDEAAAGLIADLNNSGVPAVGAKGRILSGIQDIQDRLAVQGDGKPRLSVDPSCINTINEFESYVWKQSAAGISKDEPQKENDHAMDAIRYLNDGIMPIQIF